ADPEPLLLCLAARPRRLGLVDGVPDPDRAVRLAWLAGALRAVLPAAGRVVAVLHRLPRPEAAPSAAAPLAPGRDRGRRGARAAGDLGLVVGARGGHRADLGLARADAD